MIKIKKTLSNIYKLIIYKCFKFLYGEIKSKIYPKNDSEFIVEKLKIESNNYMIFFCQNSRLYTDKIHDTAVNKNNSILVGPSFQYRRNVNEDSSLNSVFYKGTPRFKKKIKGSVFSLLTGGGGNSNYFHWLFDVLPRLFILDNSKTKRFSIDYYLFPSLSKKFQNESLDLLEIPKKKRLSSDNVRHFFSDKIIVTNHPYTLLNDPSLDSLNIPNWILDFLKNKFLYKTTKSQSSKNYPKKFYINRKDATAIRYIINEEEVVFNLKNMGYESLTLSDYSFTEQIKLFNNAEYIAGLHGAGFANMIFCKPNTKILELKPDTAGDIIKNLAIQNRLIYKHISTKPKSINYNDQSGDIEINIDLLNKILQ